MSVSNYNFLLAFNGNTFIYVFLLSPLCYFLSKYIF